ncbi:hypothetical protein EV178_000072 [Coemansia sp. RSA 1646]|nr:hypothetical protein EV178_000072 [Coemansia sp. RSA 1646]
MQRIFQRYRDQIESDELSVGNDGGDNSDDDDQEEASILERLNGIDLNSNGDNASTNVIWDRLTEDERKEFIRLLESHQIDKLITAWHPWWDPSAESKIIEINDNETSREHAGSLEDVPSIVKIDVPVIKLAKRVHPSVLLAYVYMMRHLNGDPHRENAAVAFEVLSLASPILTSKTADVYNSAHEALILSFIAIDESMNSKTKTALLDDLSKLYSTPAYVAAALSDTYSILKEILSSDILKQTRVKKSAVKYAEKRVYFLLSIAQQLIKDEDSWQFMAADISLLRRRFESESEILESSRNGQVIMKDSGDQAEKALKM